MQYTRQNAVKRLVDSYRTYYNIQLFEEEQTKLTAICEFYEHSGQYVLSRKAELWSADCEEFIYLFDTEHLTMQEFEEFRDFAREDGMGRAHIGPGHMYTYITLIVVCGSCDKDAGKALRKCHIYKSFQFSLHGWMEYHTACFAVNDSRIFTNSRGKRVGKVLKKVLFSKEREKGRS